MQSICILRFANFMNRITGLHFFCVLVSFVRQCVIDVAIRLDARVNTVARFHNRH